MDELRAEVFDVREFSSTDSYIRFLRENIRRTAGIDVELRGMTTEARAREILALLESLDALRVEDEE